MGDFSGGFFGARPSGGGRHARPPGDDQASEQADAVHAVAEETVGGLFLNGYGQGNPVTDAQGVPHQPGPRARHAGQATADVAPVAGSSAGSSSASPAGGTETADGFDVFAPATGSRRAGSVPRRDIPAAPPPELRYRRRVGLVRGARELWRARELVRTLAERDLKARYKQAVLGSMWAIVTPLLLMLVFTVVFQRVGKANTFADTHGTPYPLFSYLGLLPWTFFMSAVTQGTNSLVSNGPLLNKVYCPREVFPIATVLVAAFDMLVATGVLLLLFVALTTTPAHTSWVAPLFLVIQFEVTTGVVLLLSAGVVYFRDIRHMLPLFLQMGMFATPVAYGLDRLTREWVLPYVAANPLAAVIDGYRRTVLYGQMPDWKVTGVGAASASVLLFVGYKVFKRLETGIADVA